MPYTKQTWSDTPGVSPLSAERLNYMEQGIETATTTAEEGAGPEMVLVFTAGITNTWRF